MFNNILSGFKVSNIKKVFKKKKYLSVFLITATAMFALFYFLTFATTSFNINTFIEMNGLSYTFLGLLLSGVISLFFGLFASLYLYRFDSVREAEGKNATVSAGGFLAGIFAAGCPTCGSILLPLIGISSLGFFPFQGLEVKVASIGLLGVANVQIIKSLNKPLICKPTVKFNEPIISAKMDKVMYGTIFVVGALLLFNQLQITELSSSFDFKTAILKGNAATGEGSRIDLSGVDISQINSTAMAIATLFPVNEISNDQDAIAIMIPTGTPEYSEQLGGISFDDPVNSMEYLAKWYYTLKDEIKQNDPATWERYIGLAAAPRGISCEFCCGVGPQGITSDGELKCGCKHNPAVQALALGLMKHTEYTDAEILKEVMNWKTTFFPKNMVSLAMDVAGKDPSQLKNLPGMVGGC